MREMRWKYTDLVRISGQTQSVVSQWLGRGSKEIKTIGKLEAAIYIERESGFSALWVAKGMGPKRVSRPGSLEVREPERDTYGNAAVLSQLARLLQGLSPAARKPFADLLQGWALDGGPEDRLPYLMALLQPLEKRTGT